VILRPGTAAHTDRPSDADIPVVRQYGPAIGFAGGMAAVLEAVLELPLRRYRVELVATWSPTARFWGAWLFARALRGLVRRDRIRLIAHVHLAAGGSFVREGTVAVAAHAKGLPLVVSLHGGELPDFAERHPRLVRFVLRRADAVVALGPESAHQAQAWVPRGTRIEIIPNPVDAVAAVTPAGDSEERVVFAGTLSRLKGVDVLLDAWPEVRARRPGAQLVLAGPPGDVRVAATTGIEVPGTVTREEIRQFLADGRLAVLPSRVEVLPMFLLEAMASARPVVATPVGDISWLVGSDGQLVPVGDAPALAHAITKLLEDGDAATTAGERLRDRAERDFAPATVGAHLETLYDFAATHAAGQ
jgi:glycosyltransferase involved in cell wall biosynthesis